jgi:putative exporter of polyketide antibiotics
MMKFVLPYVEEKWWLSLLTYALFFCVFISILTLKVVCQYFCFKSEKLKEKKD